MFSERQMTEIQISFNSEKKRIVFDIEDFDLLSRVPRPQGPLVLNITLLRKTAQGFWFEGRGLVIGRRDRLDRQMMDRQIDRPTLQPPFDPSVALICHP